MLTTEDLGRLTKLVGQANAILNESGTAVANPDATRRRVTELLEEGIRLCRTARDGGPSRNGVPEPHAAVAGGQIPAPGAVEARGPGQGASARP